MKLLAIVPSLYDISPGQRYRIEQWEPILREKGVEITYSPFETDELRGVLYQPGRIAEKMKFVMKSINRRREDLRGVRDFERLLFREAGFRSRVFCKIIIVRAVPMIFDSTSGFRCLHSPSTVI